jgi:hypothetical protein
LCEILIAKKEKTTKILTVIGICSIAGLLVAKFTGLLNFAKLLTITPKLNGGLGAVKFKGATDGLHIPIAVEFGNRSDQSLTIGVSAIDLYFRGKPAAQSKPTTTHVEIKPNSTTTLKGVTLVIPYLSLLTLVGTSVTTILTSGNFDPLIAEMEMELTAIINKSIVFSIKKKFGQTAQVDASKGTLNGALGLVAASQRDIKSLSHYEMYIPPKSKLKYRDLILIPDGNVEDTIQLMQDAAKKYKGDTTLLANKLKGNTVKETLQRMFDFVYSYIKYVPDSRFVEQVRRPLRTLWDRKGDCDCYSVLIASMLENLGIPYKFRISACDGKKNYHHVYVVVPRGSETLVCDPVVDWCFYEKKPDKYKDF